MRVGFNGLGQLSVYRAGLGELCADADGIYSECAPVDQSSPPVKSPYYGDPNCPGGGMFDTVNCVNAEGDILGAPGAGGAGSGTAAPVNTNETYPTPSDGYPITGCSAYDKDGNCVTCGSGYKFNSYGGAYSGCDSIGGVPGAKKPVVQANAFSQILSSLFGTGAPRPLSASTAAACATAGGVWNGTACTAKGTVNIGGVALSTTTLLIGGVVLLMLMKKK